MAKSDSGINGYEKWLVRTLVTVMMSGVIWVASGFLGHEKLEGHPMVVKEMGHIAAHLDELGISVKEAVHKQNVIVIEQTRQGVVLDSVKDIVQDLKNSN